MTLDGVGSLAHFLHMVVPLRGCLSQSEEDEENARYPQVHLVKLNLQRHNPFMRRSSVALFVSNECEAAQEWCGTCVAAPHPL